LSQINYSQLIYTVKFAESILQYRGLYWDMSVTGDVKWLPVNRLLFMESETGFEFS